MQEQPTGRSMSDQSLRLRPEVLDAIEKYTLCAVFAFFSYRMIAGYQDSGAPVLLIYLFDQSLVILCILLRRRTNTISMRVEDWLIGFAGTFLALLFGPTSGTPLLGTAATTGIMLCGLMIHLSAKLTLRRSFGVVAANRGIKSTGPYRLVRHPMYTGYMVSQAAILLAGPTINNAIVLFCGWSLFLWRIAAEERILSLDPSYSSLTRYKLVPGIF